MSVRKIPNNREKFLWLLKEAVLKNTVRPRPEEEEKMTVSRFIRCSPEIEGDSQLGIILFCGLAHKFYGLTQSEIIDHVGIEPEEFKFKVHKFLNNYAQASRLKPINHNAYHVLSFREFDLYKMRNKVMLINNYIDFYAQKYSIIWLTNN